MSVSDRGGSLLDAEIAAQPTALRRLVATEAEGMARRGQRLRGERITGVMIAARGSSDNAARYAQYLFGVRNRLPVALAAPSLFTLYERPPDLDGLLVVGIPQSGQSPDIVAVLEEARRQGRPALALTNDVDSPLAAAATDVVDLCAGEERSVAATKTYVNSLAALALLSGGLDEGSASGSGAEAVAAALEAMPGALEEALAEARARTDCLDRYGDAGQAVVVARGFNHATAYEIALKVTELTGLAARPYSSADLLHGPIAAVSEGALAVLVAPSGRALQAVSGLVGPLRERGVSLVTCSDDPGLLSEGACSLPLPAGIPEWLSPLVAVVPGQVLAVTLARARGADPDHPAGLRKVTRTR